MQLVRPVVATVIVGCGSGVPAAECSAHTAALVAKGEPCTSMIDLGNAIKLSSSDGAASFGSRSVDPSFGDTVPAESEACAAQGAWLRSRLDVIAFARYFLVRAC